MPPLNSESRVAASLSVDGAKDYDLAPSASYAAKVRSVVSSLDSTRKRGLAALLKASTQKAQSTAAKQVAAAYSTLVK